MEGTVKWFNGKKGYGFLAGDDGQEYFVHYTSLPENTYLRENDRVSFEVAETDKGKQAKDVKLLEGQKEESQEEEKQEEEKQEEAVEEEQSE